MKCPLQIILLNRKGDPLDPQGVLPGQLVDFIQCDPFCQWWDNVEKQCAVKSMAQSLKVLATDYKDL